MKDNKLSGIERELVLQYLIDGNVPVTITPIEKTKVDTESIHSLNSQVIPIAIKGEHLKVQDNGEIILENPGKNINDLIGQRVKVEFYFNRVGLFFISELTKKKNDIKILLPNEIDRIQDTIEEKKYDFSAMVYFEYNGKKELKLNCIPWDKIEIFTRPVWKSIPLENQKAAKNLLENFVEKAKKEKNVGNGLQLIPICNYLTYKFSKKMEAMENRLKPLNILYVDHERIVLASENKSQDLKLNEEYGLKISFSIPKGPITSRDIFVTFMVQNIYSDENTDALCFDCKYTTIQEEDLRYLYEKATSSLFI